MKITVLQNIKSLLKINQRLFHGAIRKAEKIHFRAYGVSFKVIREKHFTLKRSAENRIVLFHLFSEVMSEKGTSNTLLDLNSQAGRAFGVQR